MSIPLQSIAIAVQARVPVIAWGPPGIGKTTRIVGMGEDLKYHTEVVVASLREPSDFAGLPIIVDGNVRMAPPTWALRLNEAEKGLLFLDEITTAPLTVQAALLRVVLDRVVGDLSLHDSVSVVAAANPPDQAAAGNDLAAPLANRFCHIPWGLDNAEWVEGMMSSFQRARVPVLRQGWASAIPLASAGVAGFIKHKPTALLAIPDNESQAGRAWPSPRSWHMAARLLAACDDVGASKEVTIQLVTGCVGEGLGIEFFQWRAALDLPDPEDVLANPDKWTVPERADKVFTVLASVVAAVNAKTTKGRYVAAWKVIHQVVLAGQKDVAAAAVLPLARGSAGREYLADREVRSELLPISGAFADLLHKAGLGR